MGRRSDRRRKLLWCLAGIILLAVAYRHKRTRQEPPVRDLQHRKHAAFLAGQKNVALQYALGWLAGWLAAISCGGWNWWWTPHVLAKLVQRRDPVL
jgi:hypothetical protein